MGNAEVLTATTATPARPSGLGTLARAVEARLALWYRRATTRRELAGLDGHRLRDLGLDPVDAQREAAKWFWQA